GRHVLSISSGGVPMNPVERVLNRELSELLDRLAASVPEGSLEQIRASSPTLRARLDEAELSLAAVRAALIEGYGRWRRALEERAHAPRELLAVARALGHGRGQPVRPPPRDQRVEAREVHRLFDSLAQLGLDAGAEVTRLAGVAAG